MGKKIFGCPCGHICPYEVGKTTSSKPVFHGINSATVVRQSMPNGNLRSRINFLVAEAARLGEHSITLDEPLDVPVRRGLIGLKYGVNETDPDHPVISW